MINSLIKYLDTKRKFNTKKFYHRWLDLFVLFFFHSSHQRFIDNSFAALKERIGSPKFSFGEEVFLFYSTEECSGVITHITLDRDEEWYSYGIEFKFQNQNYKIKKLEHQLISKKYRNQTNGISFNELIENLKEKSFNS